MTRTGDAGRPPIEVHADSAMDWARANARAIGIGAIALAVVLGGGALWRRSSAIKEERAGKALSEAQRSFASGNLPLAQSDLQKVVQRYGGTRAGIQARLLLAQVHFGQGKPVDGVKTLDDINSPGVFASAVHALKGAGMEQQNKPIEAADHYLQAAKDATSDIQRDGYRVDAARAYAAGNRPADAIKIWQSMAADESSAYSSEARVRLGELTAKPAA